MILVPLSILAIENETDRDFMEQVYTSYKRLMYYEIGFVTDDPWAKEGILQTTIIQLINNISTIRSMPSKLLANYVATSARNTALTYVRNYSRRKEILTEGLDTEDYPDEWDNDPLSFIVNAENLHFLLDAWNELDEKSRFLLNSRYIQNKSFAEIASELQVKPDSARMALTRARRTAYNIFNRKTASG